MRLILLQDSRGDTGSSWMKKTLSSHYLLDSVPIWRAEHFYQHHSVSSINNSWVFH